MIRLYSRISSPSLLSSVPISLRSALLRSQYATKAATRIPPTKLQPKAHIPKIVKTSSEKLSPAATRQQYRANQVYARGVRNVYTAPSHIGMLAMSWTVGSSLLAYTIWLGIEGNWNVGDRMSGWQKTIVESGYRLGMIFFGFFGGYALLRYTGLVRSIDLISKGGNAKLSLKVRRLVPFLKPREVIISTYDVSLPPNWMLQIDDLSLETGDLQRKGFNFNLGKIFWIPFVRFRAWVFRHGVVDLKYQEESRRALLDLTGDFSNRGADLWELTATPKASR